MTRSITTRSILLLPGPWAFLILIYAHVLLALDQEPAVTWFYPIAWWSYILIVDSFIYLRREKSLFMSQPKELLLMALLSLPLWLVFESFNFTLRNWYYVGVSPDLRFRILGQVLSFSTVLPLLLISADALAATTLFRSSRWTPRPMGGITPFLLFVVGLIMLGLPFYNPNMFFPLPWGVFFFLLEPINRHLGAPSLLRDIEEGRPRRFLLLLAAGAIAGLLWETWNYWADAKWIYTVPVVGRLKIFEMPLLGFLGFPPFAVQCYTIYNFVGLLRERIPWRLDNAESKNNDKAMPRLLPSTVYLSAAIFSITVMAGIEFATVDSIRPSLSAVESLVKIRPGGLESLSVRSPEDLLRVGAMPEGRERLARELGMNTDGVVAWLSAVELMLFKGIGEDHFLQLRQAGVFKISHLKPQNPKTLTKNMFDAFKRDVTARVAPDERKTRAWIYSARGTRSRYSAD